jgi:hypothetical protein
LRVKDMGLWKDCYSPIFYFKMLQYF